MNTIGFKEKIIDGETYQFGMFQVPQATRELTGLLDIFGTSIGDIVSSLDKKESSINIMDQDVNMGIIGKAIGNLCTRIHEKNIADTIIRFMSQVVHVKCKNGQPGSGLLENTFNTHFQGRLLHMTKVFGAAVGVQYSDFLEGIGGVQGFLKKAITTLGKQTLQDGNGISGDQ